MPVILTQHFAPQDRVYQDAEFSLYHYPRVYFSRIEPYDRFIYYRPLGKSVRRQDSMHYFGHGRLGQWIVDVRRDDHRFVDLISASPFPRLVPIRDASGSSYETEAPVLPQFQAAVRRISETAYHRVLSAAGVTANMLDALPNTEAVSAFYRPSAILDPPRDAFRRILEVPAGAGYVPTGKELNVYESAALQERARADHQRVLQLVVQRVHALGGTCSYNNNVDLLAEFDAANVLVEAKSLGSVHDAVDRMRYGLGQLADYEYRYKAELRGATPILAFGRPPDRETGWLADVLEENRVGFVARVNEELVPLNGIARESRLFAG